MKRNDLYLLTQYKNKYFLKPVGQDAADHKPVLALNATGAFLWKALAEPVTEEDLLARTASHFSQEKEKISVEVRDYLKVLAANGLLEEEPGLSASVSSDTACLTISGIRIRITSPENILNDPLSSFLTEEELPIDMDVTVRSGLPARVENGVLLVRTKEMAVLENEKGYVLLFPERRRFSEMRVSKDLTKVSAFVLPPFDEKLKQDFFIALRFPFLLMALKKGMVMLHSASILYREQVFCFSAPAGTGKTTHVNLWKDLCDTPVINGDLNLLSPTAPGVTVYGTPWCGTSGIFDNSAHPLGGIVFLKRSGQNRAVRLGSEEGFQKLLARTVTPSLTLSEGEEVARICEKLADLVNCYLLECNVSPEAVKIIRQEIDEGITGSAGKNLRSQ